MSKQFKCPKCGSTEYVTRPLSDSSEIRFCVTPSCLFDWHESNDSKYLTEIPYEPPRPTVKEIPISYKNGSAGCVIVYGNPMTLQKIACYNWETFAGYVYADKSIEADFKRMRNGQVEWATKVRVKE